MTPFRFCLQIFLGLAIIIATASAFVPQVFAQSLQGTLADERVAASMGLDVEWILQLPFDSTQWRLQHVVIGDGLVVAQSTDGGVHAIKTLTSSAPMTPKSSAKKPDQPSSIDIQPQPSPSRIADMPPGALLWSHRIGHPGGPVHPAGIGSNVVTVSRDLDVFALERITGQTRWHDRIHRSPVHGATPSGQWVYVPLSSDSVIRLAADPKAQSAASSIESSGKEKSSTAKKKKSPKQTSKKKESATGAIGESVLPIELAAGGRVETQPNAFFDGVLWCTRTGTLVCLEPIDAGWDRHEILLRSPIAGRPFVRDAMCVVATVGGDLVRVDLLTTKGSGFRIQWFHPMGAIPVDGVFVVDDRVIVPLELGELAAFSVSTGLPLWRCGGVESVLCINDERIWFVDQTGKLASLDPVSGERRESLKLGPFQFLIRNDQTDRLYMATHNGVLASLHASGKKTAVNYATASAGESAKGTVKTKSGSPDTSQDAPSESPPDDSAVAPDEASRDTFESP